MIRLATLFLILAAPAFAQDIVGSVRVVDGDTLYVDGVKIRLWGIDAPEAGTLDGNAATAFLRDLLVGGTIECDDTGGRSHRRIVARCFLGDLDIADALIDNGHAVDWPKFSGGHYAR